MTELLKNVQLNRISTLENEIKSIENDGLLLDKQYSYSFTGYGHLCKNVNRIERPWTDRDAQKKAVMRELEILLADARKNLIALEGE